MASDVHRTTPGSLYHLSLVMPHGNFTGDESLNIDKVIHIINNQVWIGDYNTQINVKGKEELLHFQKKIGLIQ